jgi:hypothetical protein
MKLLVLLGVALSGCVVATPKPGSCECVCAWRHPTDETGRFFRVIFEADGGIR